MWKKTIFWTVGALLGVRVLLAALTPVFDTSEARYAAISANMARTGDFLVPHFTYRGVYQSFDGKPPLLFQAGGVCCRALGVRALAVRLPVLIASAVLLCLLWRVVLILSGGDRRTAGLAVGLAASSTSFYALAGFCMTDGLLVLCVAGALLCHAALVQTGNRNWSLGVFALLGLGRRAAVAEQAVEEGEGGGLAALLVVLLAVLRALRQLLRAAEGLHHLVGNAVQILRSDAHALHHLVHLGQSQLGGALEAQALVDLLVLLVKAGDEHHRHIFLTS